MKIYKLKIIYEAVAEYPSILIHGPSDIFDYMQEAFYVLPLNRKHRPLGRYMTSLGTVNETLVHPREVFLPLILTSASAFIVCHNHPSSDPAPKHAGHSNDTQFE